MGAVDIGFKGRTFVTGCLANDCSEDVVVRFEDGSAVDGDGGRGGDGESGDVV